MLQGLLLKLANSFNGTCNSVRLIPNMQDLTTLTGRENGIIFSTFSYWLCKIWHSNFGKCRNFALHLPFICDNSSHFSLFMAIFASTILPLTHNVTDKTKNNSTDEFSLRSVFATRVSSPSSLKTHLAVEMEVLRMKIHMASEHLFPSMDFDALFCLVCLAMESTKQSLALSKLV